MATIARDIFKAYDIRGIVGKTLTNEAAYLIGRAIGTQAAEKNIRQIALGRDGRLSGPELMENLTRGITESGIDVLNVGMVATPMLYFAAWQHVRMLSEPCPQHRVKGGNQSHSDYI